MHFFYKKYFNFKFFPPKLFFLVFFLLLLSLGYFQKNNLVKAFNAQLKIFPNSYSLEEGDDSMWRNVNQVFSQDLSPQAGLKEFNQNNSAYLLINADLPYSEQDSAFFNSDNGGEGENDGANVDSGLNENKDSSQTDDQELEEDQDENNQDNNFEEDIIVEGMEMNQGDGENNANNFLNTNQGGDLESSINDGENGTNSNLSIPDDEEENKQSENVEIENNSVGSDSEKEVKEILELEENEVDLKIEDSPAPEENNIESNTSFSDIWLRLANSFDNVFNFKEARAEENIKYKKIKESIIFRDFSVPGGSQEENGINQIILRSSWAGGGDIQNGFVLFEFKKKDEWIKLALFDLLEEYSNLKVGDYFSFNLPNDIGWDDLVNLQIRFSYLNENFQEDSLDLTKIFLDSLWLEIDYDDLNQKLNQDENSQDLAQLEASTSDEIILFEKVEKTFDFDFLSGQIDFQYKEKPEFRFQYKRKKGILGKIASAVLGLFRDEYKSLNVEVLVKTPEGKEIEGLFDFQYMKDGEFEIKAREILREFKPGLYKIEILIQDGEEVYLEEQDFSWGVLAFNSNKTVYYEGEEAYLQMAVLDMKGHTLCDSDLYLTIREPGGRRIHLNTNNNLIKRNSECGPDNVIDSPDYYSFYKVKDSGIYQITLIAYTDQGKKQINDFFEVDDNANISFDLERTGPTRIFPKAAYKMAFRIKAQNDFNGQLKEYIPSSFKLLKGDGIFLRELDDAKELSWSVNFRAGEVYDFSYIFDAPDISPEFYLLGEAKLVSNSSEETVFEEKRFWQIASDALDLDVSFDKTNTDNPYDGTEETLASLSGLSDGETYLIFSGIGSNRWDGGSVRTEISLGTTTPEDDSSHFPHLVENLEGPNSDDGASLFMMGKKTWTGGDTLYYRADKITGGADLGADEVFLMAMATSTMGEYGKDYFWAEDNSSSALTMTNGTNYASVTFTPNGTSEYLIIGVMEVDVGATGEFVQMDVYNGSNVMLSHIRDTEDDRDTMQMFVATTSIPSAVSTTYSVRGTAETSSTGNHLSSRILIIRLDYYANHSCQALKDSGAMGTSPSVRASTDLSLDSAGDVVVLYFGGFSSANQTSSVSARARYDSSTEYQITDDDVSNGEGRINVWQSNSDIHTTLWMDNISVPDTSSHTYDFSYERSGTAGANYEYALVCAWSEEPAVQPLAVTAEEQYKSDGTTAISNGDWSDGAVNLSALASNISDSTDQLDYYFEIVEDSSSFTTATSSLASSACSSGVNYSSCTSKIWKTNQSFSWYNSDWIYRKKITLNASQIDADLNKFPILATTTDSNFAYSGSGGHMGSSTGADIVITDSSGTTTIPYEREYYNSSTGEIVLWIKADLLSSVNTDIYIYYGNSSVSRDYASSSDVWDSNYKAVWHLSESGSGTRYDSTANNNNGTPSNFEGNEGVSAKIDGGD
jgi:hypothetical protein